MKSRIRRQTKLGFRIHPWMLLAGALCTAFLLVTATEAETHQKKTLTPIETIKRSVGFIFGSYERGGIQKGTAGTGFFVFWPDRRLGESGGFVHFVTVKHVLQDEDGNFLPEVTVRLNNRNYDPSVQTSGFQLFRIPAQDAATKNSAWHFNPDPEADVAVFPRAILVIADR